MSREAEPGVARPWISEALQELLRRTHLSMPADVPGTVVDQAAISLGASEVGLYLIDYEQAMLKPLAGTAAAGHEPLSVTGTVAGRAFSGTTILRAPAEEAGRQRLWLPLLDGTERIGVMSMCFAEEALSGELVKDCERYSHLVALVIVTKDAYGDAFEVSRRRHPMTIASELAWGLAPPLVFATDDVILAGMLEPAYDNGGDALDYALNGRVLHLGVFDAMGHGLAAAGVAAFAISAYRHSRRTGRDLLQTYEAMDQAVGQQFPDNRFVTAVIARLDIDTGRLTWISAGHPPPLIIRGGRRSRVLEAPAATPLGVEFAAEVAVNEEALEPGDAVLFYTDGLTEARGPDGSMLSIDGVSQFIEREAAGGQSAPETLRRLRHAIIVRERAELHDDATALLVEWRRSDPAGILPQTVV